MKYSTLQMSRRVPFEVAQSVVPLSSWLEALAEALRRWTGAVRDWIVDAQPRRPAVAIVRVERKKTVFYPIGWMAILGAGAWFTWLGWG